MKPLLEKGPRQPRWAEYSDARRRRRDPGEPVRSGSNQPTGSLLRGADMSDWREQLERVVRFLARLQNHDRPKHDYEDDLWAFFQNCWHLKDWIKNDPALDPSTRRTLLDRAHACA